ncbi:transcription repressor [Ligilactobacillus acidipiscis]|uniref:transcription repressor n=1 Tax=Ligilactobacillus acidipiscis TaxID=89059 RepID=UPI0022E4D14B|nr:transcription repressor [Ligilactobacillus acidipiscis]
MYRIYKQGDVFLIFETIKALAATRNIPLRTIEISLGLPAGTFQTWNQTAPCNKLVAVARYFHVSVETLLG